MALIKKSVKLRHDGAKARAAAKALLKAGQAGDDGQFLYQLHQLKNTMNGWTLAMRQIARLGQVSKEIQSAFALMWTADRHLPCTDPHAFLDAMRVLFPPYRGPAMYLFRGHLPMRRARESSMEYLGLRTSKLLIGSRSSTKIPRLTVWCLRQWHRKSQLSQLPVSTVLITKLRTVSGCMTRAST